MCDKIELHPDNKFAHLKCAAKNVVSKQVLVRNLKSICENPTPTPEGRYFQM